MAIFIFILGTVLGSFYLVVATRLPRGEDIVKSRSYCDSCKHQLKWYNLIPVFSYVFQKGKCIYCKKKISLECLLVELIAGLGFLICYLSYGFSYEFFLGVVVFSLTVVIYISDFKYLVILDSSLVVAGLMTILIKFFYLGLNQVFFSVLNGLVMFLVMFLIQKMGEVIFKKEALGGGDVKLAFVIGLILNVPLGLAAIVLSTFLALPYSVAYMYIEKNNEVAYGPFLAGALMIIFFTMDKFTILLDFLFSWH